MDVVWMPATQGIDDVSAGMFDTVNGNDKFVHDCLELCEVCLSWYRHN
jgi:hypothetical protein